MGRFTFEVPSPGGPLVVSISPEASRQGRTAATPENRAALFSVLTILEAGGPAAEELASQLAAALGGGSELLPARRPALSPERDLLFEREVRQAFDRGNVEARPVPRRSAPETRGLAPEGVPPPPPAKERAEDTFFEARFVDETGAAVGQFPVAFTHAGSVFEKKVTGAGVALLEHVPLAGATIETAGAAALEKILDDRWSTFRPGKPAKEGNSRDVVFLGRDVGPFDLKPAVPNRVVLHPPLGCLFARLRDKTGRVTHAKRKYSVKGPQSFSGTTDDAGCLKHEDVFPGDYRLELTLEFFEGKDRQVDTYESALVVLPPGAGAPEVRLIGAVPRVVLARVQMLFDTSKAFLLPTGLPAFRKLRELYLENSPSRLLVVGHADTAGDAEFNSKLSLERAKAVIAYLKDEVDPWLAFYEPGVEKAKRWGSAEDTLMIASMPDFGTKPRGQSAVTWYQSTRGLTVDGVAGPKTRRKLVEEYMSLDGANLEDAGLRIEATAHGCGEHFPLDDTGERVDAAPADGKRDPVDRRVELFFFDEEFGVLPAPPGETSAAGSKEYPEWRKNVVATHVFDAGNVDGPEVTIVELADAHFRTDSAVVLPEGETPSSSENESLTSIGVIATSLRFNQENGDRRVLVAGHADTTGNTDYNQILSEERAECALALLVGDREAFKTRCDERHKVSDYKQILRWLSQAFEDVVFDCEPGVIDDNAATGVAPVKRFQRSYNTNKTALGAEAPDLVVDGDVGPLTWGAFFDCYEFALRRELGEDAAGLAALRGKLVFVDDARRSLGFGEHFPVEELGVDGYRSQANRRVEILFFEPGEEPDLEHAENDPETSELYLPGGYSRVVVEPMASAKPWRARWASETASSSAPGELVLLSPGAPDGTEVEFFVTCDLTAETRSVSAVCAGGQARAPFSDFEELLATVNAQDFGEDPFPAVEYSFEAEGGGRRVEAERPLVFQDDLDVNVAFALDSADGAELGELPYTLVTLLGERHASTSETEGDSARVKEGALPPGGVTLLVESTNAAGRENGGQVVQ